MSTAISTSMTSSATSLATLQVHSTGPSGNARARRSPAASSSTLCSVEIISTTGTPSALQRGAHFGQGLDRVGAARLRPLVPVRLHGVDRARDLLGLGVGQGIAGGGERTLR